MFSDPATSLDSVSLLKQAALLGQEGIAADAFVATCGTFIHYQFEFVVLCINLNWFGLLVDLINKQYAKLIESATSSMDVDDSDSD